MLFPLGSSTPRRVVKQQANEEGQTKRPERSACPCVAKHIMSMETKEKMSLIRLFHSFTMSGRAVEFVTDDVMAFITGNLVALFSISRREQSTLTFDQGMSK